MMAELKSHGYRIGPGTLYPLLHGSEQGGLLNSAITEVGGRKPRVYKVTPLGRKALSKARIKADELRQELHANRPHRIGTRGRS